MICSQVCITIGVVLDGNQCILKFDINSVCDSILNDSILNNSILNEVMILE